ncbi:MAG: tetratricopeptide repeat protein, partial [Nannocystaceae bacterium]
MTYVESFATVGDPAVADHRRGGHLLAWVVAALAAVAPMDVRGAAPGAEEPEESTEDGSTDRGPAEVAWEPPAESMPAPERARVWWLRAQELERAKQFRESATAYKRSYEAMPTLAALYNMALAHDYARQPLDAIAAYRRYAEQSEVDDLERAQVLDRIAELEGEVARIVIALPEDYVEGSATIDELAVVPDTQGNLVLPGPHDVAVRDGQGATRLQRVVVAPGTRVVVRFDEPPREPSRPVVSPTPEMPIEEPSEPGAGRLRLVRRGMWVSLGLTAASSAALVGVGVATLNAKRNFEDSLCDGPCPDGATYDAEGATRFYQLRTTTNVLI